MGNEIESLKGKMREEMERFGNDPEYRSEGYFFDIAEQVLEQMERQNINKAQLARKMGCSKSYVTQLFKGTTNITLLTLAKMAIAVNAEWDFTLLSSESENRLKNTHKSDEERDQLSHTSKKQAELKWKNR